MNLADLEPLTAHCLRHTFGSLAASKGVRPEVISSWMGHWDVGFTMKTYVGLFADDLQSSADLLDAR